MAENKVYFFTPCRIILPRPYNALTFPDGVGALLSLPQVEACSQAENTSYKLRIVGGGLGLHSVQRGYGSAHL